MPKIIPKAVDVEVPGWVPGVAKADAVLSRLPPSEPWYYAAHPARLTVQYGKVYHDLLTLVQMPGCNNTGKEEKGIQGGNPDRAKSFAKDRRLIWIEPIEVFGILGHSYVKPIPVMGGTAYVTYEETPIPGTVLTKIDHAARERIHDAIATLLPPIEVYALEALEARLQRDFDLASIDAERDPRARRQKEAAERDIRVVRAAIEKATDPEASDTSTPTTADKPPRK